MGRMKFRQGVSVDLGLKMNRPKTKERVFRGVGKAVERQASWLMATLCSFIRPFTQVKNKFQQYRRKV